VLCQKAPLAGQDFVPTSHGPDARTQKWWCRLAVSVWNGLLAGSIFPATTPS